MATLECLILSIFENFIDAWNHVVHKINGFSNSDTFSVQDQWDFAILYPLILLVVRNTKVDYKGASACINRHINHGMDAALILMELH